MVDKMTTQKTPEYEIAAVITRIGVEVMKDDFQKENSSNRIDKPEGDRL